MAWSISKAMMRDYENSNCSQGQAGESSAPICSDTAPSALSNTTPMLDQYFWPDKTTEHSRLSRFGMTCVPLTADRGEELLTWYRAAFHARTSAHQGGAQESKGSEAAYGARWSGLLARFDHSARVWKTAQCSLVEDLERFSETWPRWGTMLNGVAYQEEVSVPIMSVIESGSWLPTPTCHNAKEGAYPAEYARNTPTLATHVGGRIHPNFTEWMMGWPLDWTDLKPLETAKFQAWLQQHGRFSLHNYK